jgi:hypothetical protein
MYDLILDPNDPNVFSSWSESRPARRQASTPAAQPAIALCNLTVT